VYSTLTFNILKMKENRMIKWGIVI